MLNYLLTVVQELHVHEGDHDILQDSHHHHDHAEKSGRSRKVAALLVTGGLIAAFVLWRML